MGVTLRRRALANDAHDTLAPIAKTHLRAFEYAIDHIEASANAVVHEFGAAFADHEQRRRFIVGMIPNSLAISACVRPLVSHKATASRLNSRVKYLFQTFAILHLLAPKSLSSVSAKARDDHPSIFRLALLLPSNTNGAHFWAISACSTG